MNKKMIIYILGKMLGVEGVVLLLPALVSLIYQEEKRFFLPDCKRDTRARFPAVWKKETEMYQNLRKKKDS